MIQYALLSDGCADRYGRGYSIPDGFVQVPDDIPYGMIGSMMVVDGEWVPRPVLPDPVTVDGVTTMKGAPPGTVCEVNDLDVGVILATVEEDGGLIEIELPDPGTYLLEYAPPRPYLPLSVRVVTP